MPKAPCLGAPANMIDHSVLKIDTSSFAPPSLRDERRIRRQRTLTPCAFPPCTLAEVDAVIVAVACTLLHAMPAHGNVELQLLSKQKIAKRHHEPTFPLKCDSKHVACDFFRFEPSVPPSVGSLREQLGCHVRCAYGRIVGKGILTQDGACTLHEHYRSHVLDRAKFLFAGQSGQPVLASNVRGVITRWRLVLAGGSVFSLMEAGPLARKVKGVEVARLHVMTLKAPNVVEKRVEEKE